MRPQSDLPETTQETSDNHMVGGSPIVWQIVAGGCWLFLGKVSYKEAKNSLKWLWLLTDVDRRCWLVCKHSWTTCRAVVNLGKNGMQTRNLKNKSLQSVHCHLVSRWQVGFFFYGFSAINASSSNHSQTGWGILIFPLRPVVVTWLPTGL